MVALFRRRQTKEPETDTLGLTPPRHIPTLRKIADRAFCLSARSAAHSRQPLIGFASSRRLDAHRFQIADRGSQKFEGAGKLVGLHAACERLRGWLGGAYQRRPPPHRRSDGDGRALAKSASMNQHPAKCSRPKPSQGARNERADHTRRDNGSADPKCGIAAPRRDIPANADRAGCRWRPNQCGEHQVPSQMQERAYQGQDDNEAEGGCHYATAVGMDLKSRRMDAIR